MKRRSFTAGLLALTLMLSLVLASCGSGGGGGLSGTYASEDGSAPDLTFSGNKVSFSGTEFGLDVQMSATYKIEGDNITMTIDKSDLKNALNGMEGISDIVAGSGLDLDALVDEALNGMGGQSNTASFSQSGDTITIDGTTYTKQ